MADPSFTPLLLTLPSLTPSLALEVLPAGLTLHRLFVQADGKTHDVLIGPEDPTGHIAQKYTNTVIGRYSNRLPVGSFSVSRNGITSTVTPQGNEKPNVSLHGGAKGFDAYAWEPLVDPSQTKLFTSAELQTIQTRLPSSVIFTRVSEDGEEGYPGKLLLEVLVGLAQPEGPPVPTADGKKEWSLGSVVLVYRAKLLDEGKVTPINLTQHWGFNLDASLNQGPKTLKVDDHKIAIKADHTILLDSDALSTGSLAPVAGTPHAHAEKADGRIGDKFPERGYDEFYVFSKPSTAVPTVLPAADLAPSLDLVGAAFTNGGPAADEVVSLSAGKSGLRLGFATNQAGVQFYTNNLAVPEKGARKKIHGGSGTVGDGYGPGTAAFLEFHAPLAAWLHPETRGPSGGDTLLASGEVYNNFVRLDVFYKGAN